MSDYLTAAVLAVLLAHVFLLSRDVRRLRDEACRKTRTLERRLRELDGRVDGLERARRKEREEARAADRWMEEGMANILSFTPEKARKGANYEDGAGGL